MMGSLLLASAGDRRRTIIRLLLLPRSLLLLQSLLFAFLLEYFAGISADLEGKLSSATLCFARKFQRNG